MVVSVGLLESDPVKITVASLDKKPMVALRSRAKALGLTVESEEATYTRQDDPHFGEPVYIVRLEGDVADVLTGKLAAINTSHQCGRATDRLWWAR